MDKMPELGGGEKKSGCDCICVIFWIAIILKLLKRAIKNNYYFIYHLLL